MSRKKFSLLLVSVILVASMAVLWGDVLSRPKSQNSTIEQFQADRILQPTKTVTESYVPGLPVRLIIPKINVSASIESLGLTSDGDLDAPKNIINAGWYNAGPRAGSPGSAVIDGHFGAADNKPAIFDNLHTMQKGDLLYVEDGNGDTHSYIVRETRLFQPDENTDIVFRSDDNKAHLNLITCHGKWENRNESYSARLVVFTDLLE